MKRAALYMRVSTLDQNPANQLADLRQLAQQRGFQVVAELVDHGYSGARAKRPALDQLMVAARRGQYDVVIVWAIDRMARSVRHFLETIDELNRLGVEFVSVRENLDTAGPLGRAITIIVAAIAELERSLIIERVRAGMRRARLEGTHIGRRPAGVDREAVLRDRARGRSLTQVATAHGISRALVSKIVRQAGGHKGVLPLAAQVLDSSTSESAV